MPWLQLIAELSPDGSEAFGNWLSEAGALAVTLEDAADQPLYEPDPGTTPLWRSTRVTGLFEAHEDLEAIGRDAEARGLCPAGRWRVTPLEDKDWDRQWMDRFHPMRFGERVWIVPSWHAPPDPEAVNILLDPGLAFGTGTHPTTRLCLEWLDSHPPEGSVIDYGCGSGVLAIAAVKLGADRVWAVDNDLQAVTATRENAARNGVAERIEASLPSARHAPAAELLLANILANPLVELAPALASCVQPGGEIVLSGILPEQAKTVADTYRRAFRMDASEEKDGWTLLHGTRIG